MLRLFLAFLVVACNSPKGTTGGDDTPDAAVTPMADAAQSDPDAPASYSCAGKTTQPLDADWSITVGNLTRTAKVHVPASYDPNKPTPVVFNIHGRTHNAAGQAQLSHAIAKSNAAGFIVVHPQAWGSPTSWNSGGGCCDPAYSNNIDDVGFMAKLLDELEAKLCVDRDRVYAMGLSNGGYLAHRIACDLEDRFAAIGSVAGLLQGNCAPTRPMPLYQIHGTADQLVPYSWVDATMDYWTVMNGCGTPSQTFQNGDTACVTYAGCDAGADVVLCTVTDGGHQWPGGDELPFLGKKTNAIIATDVLWDFFVAHPMPPR